jgi:hypothetical protein
MNSLDIDFPTTVTGLLNGANYTVPTPPKFPAAVSPSGGVNYANPSWGRVAFLGAPGAIGKVQQTEMPTYPVIDYLKRDERIIEDQQNNGPQLPDRNSYFGDYLQDRFDLQNTLKNSYARGGKPPVGRQAVVGERGPELFVPDRALNTARRSGAKIPKLKTDKKLLHQLRLAMKRGLISEKAAKQLFGIVARR